MLSDQISNKKNFLINLIKIKYCYSVHNASNKFNFVKSKILALKLCVLAFSPVYLLWLLIAYM